ncbi:MAG: hypothetical protein IKA95_01050, partial [Clostridia bacterium]|nr:hypothetical protein [Clostridia bacterium]
YVANDAVISEAQKDEALVKGDILQLTFDNDGRASVIEKIMDYDPTAAFPKKSLPGLGGSTGLYGEYTKLLGEVTHVDHTNYRFTVNYGAEQDAVLGYDAYLAKITVFDRSEGKVYDIPSTSLMVGDDVVILNYRYQARAMIAYRD